MKSEESDYKSSRRGFLSHHFEKKSLRPMKMQIFWYEEVAEETLNWFMFLSISHFRWHKWSLRNYLLLKLHTNEVIK